MGVSVINLKIFHKKKKSQLRLIKSIINFLVYWNFPTIQQILFTVSKTVENNETFNITGIVDNLQTD